MFRCPPFLCFTFYVPLSTYSEAHLPFELVSEAREPSRHNRLHLPKRCADGIVHRANRVVVEHVEHIELERVHLVAVPEVLLEVDVELIPALAIQRAWRRQDERLRLSALSAREQSGGRAPLDDSLETAEALHDGADVHAQRQRVVSRELELVEKRHVEFSLIAEPSAARDVPALVQIAGRRPVRIVVV